VWSAADCPANLLRKLRGLRLLGDGFLAVGGGSTLRAAARCADSRRSRAGHPFLGGAVRYFLLLTLLRYGPERYYTPLGLPLPRPPALACAALVRRALAAPDAWRWLALPVLAAAACVIGAGADRIGLHLAAPQFTLVETARGIGSVVARRDPTCRPLVM